MSQEARFIPVISLSDRTGRSHLSIEMSGDRGGAARLFTALSGSSFMPAKSDLGRIEAALSGLDASQAEFEDVGKALLRRALGKMNFKAEQKPRPQRYSRISWLRPNGPDLPGEFEIFGVHPDVDARAKSGMRRMRLRHAGKEIGEMLFTDYGRFARCKSNESGMEGFCRCRSHEELSEIFTVAYRALGSEGKRYLIFGSEFADYLDCVHPFPLWHMALESPTDLDHRCRAASKADADLLARLTSEYEDSPQQTALRGVSRRLLDPSFKYVLSGNGEGFALLKFKEGAEGLLHDLFVTPSQQGRGFGEQLVRASLSMMSSTCIRIHLNTIYPRALRLYTKYGFRIDYTDHCVALDQVIMSRGKD
ncbi:MAG TPA: N-acetyltransferase [Euryarchaeota archaeon]|nr:N-acetyltransferase [Euryarchaeota archaeon]